jgi:hypothetical protein
VTVATTVTLSNLTRLHSVKRRLGLRLYNRGCLKPVAAGVLAVGATSLAELVLPLPAGIWSVLIVGPVFLVWFVALLMAFGLSSGDRQLLAAL